MEQPMETTNPEAGVEQSMEDRVAALFDKPEEQQQEQQQEPTEETPTEDPTDSQEQSEELEEAEYEGKQYKLPKGLKEALMRQSDYTQKTQQVAEQRRTAETLLQQAQQVQELQKASAKHLGKLASIDERLEQYKAVDWNALTLQDPTQAQAHFMAFQQLKDQKADATRELEGIQRQTLTAQHQAKAARLEEGHKALARDIKGWNGEVAQKLASLAQKAYGFSAEEAAGIDDPRMVRILHDAAQWRSLQESKPALEKRAPVVGQTLKPKGSDSRNTAQQEHETLRRAVRSAKTDSERAKPLEALILRKLG
jgi:hypothetical protein